MSSQKGTALPRGGVDRRKLKIYRLSLNSRGRTETAELTGGVLQYSIVVRHLEPVIVRLHTECCGPMGRAALIVPENNETETPRIDVRPKSPCLRRIGEITDLAISIRRNRANA